MKMRQPTQQLHHVPCDFFHRHELATSRRHVLVQISFIPITAMHVNPMVKHPRACPTISSRFTVPNSEKLEQRHQEGNKRARRNAEEEQHRAGHLLHQNAFAGADVNDANKVRVRMILDAFVHLLVYLSPISFLRPPLDDPISGRCSIRQISR